MISFVDHSARFSMQRLLLSASLAIMLLITACQKQDASTAQAGPATFASPEAAGQALVSATKSQDRSELLRIFGSGAADLVSTGDPVEKKASLDGFTQAYQQMNRWRRLRDGSELLLVGSDNQTFPIPLVKNAAGQWYFNIAAGKDEILSRRIGKNEIRAIGVCAAVADAQDQYFSQKRAGTKQYAQKFISDPGQQDGLYWNAPQGSPRSPLGPLVAYATAEGYKVQPNDHQPFNGYYFAMLDKQGSDAQGGAKNYVVDGKMTGGFGVVAYPAHYGDSGIMTFIVNQKGVIFQKDLGKGTEQIASAMTEFNPDKTWDALQ